MTPPRLSALHLLRAAQAVAHGREHEVLEHLDVVGVDDLGRDAAPTAPRRRRSRRPSPCRHRPSPRPSPRPARPAPRPCRPASSAPASSSGSAASAAAARHRRSAALALRHGVRSVSVAGDFLDDGGAEALGDEASPNLPPAPPAPSSTSSVRSMHRRRRAAPRRAARRSRRRRTPRLGVEAVVRRPGLNSMLAAELAATARRGSLSASFWKRGTATS